MENDAFEEALERLSLNERLLEEAKAQTIDIDPDYVLVTLHNIACCHQGLTSTENSASYIEACLYNLKESPRVKTSRGNEKFKLRKYECRARTQLCALLSQLGKHEAALSHAKVGLKLAQSLVLDVLTLCKEHISRHRKLLPTAQSKPTSETAKRLESASYKHSQDLVKKAYPVLELIESRLLSKQRLGVPQPSTRLEVRSTLGVQHYTDWIYSFNMGDLMKIQPLTLYELKSTLETYSELTRDMLLDKVCLLVAGYFCISTELRLLYGEEDVIKLKEAQNLHLKALQIARDVLPLEAPLLEHLQVSYQKHFSELPQTSVGKTSYRTGKLDTSLASRSPVGANKNQPFLCTTSKPRSSSAKSTHRSVKPAPLKPKSPAPQYKRRPVDKREVAIPLTERGPSGRTSSRKRETPMKGLIDMAVQKSETSSEEEFVLSSSDLYGPEDQLDSRRLCQESSVEIREMLGMDIKGKVITEYGRNVSSTGGN